MCMAKLVGVVKTHFTCTHAHLWLCVWFMRLYCDCDHTSLPLPSFDRDDPVNRNYLNFLKEGITANQDL